MATIQERSQYKPDGRMRWSLAPLLLLVPLAVAIAGAYTLNVLFMHGWYFVLLVPLAIGGLVTFSLWVMVAWTHCRKPWLACFLGLLMGSVCYLGYYHVGMIQMMPPGLAHRVDRLPDYILFRMTTDVQADPGRPNDKPLESDRFMNWFTFIYEFAFMAGMAAEAARRRALAAYDSKNNCWMEKETIAFQVGVRDELARALESESVEQFCQTHRPVAINPQNSLCTVLLEYTRADNVSPLESPIYLSATESSIGSWFASFFRRSRMLEQTEITREEALDFQPLFAGFDKLLRERHEELRELPTEVAGTQSDLVRTATSHANIQPITEQDQCGIFSGWNLLATNMIGGGMLVGFAGGPALCYAAYHFYETIGIVGAIVVAAIGIVMFLASIYVATCCPTAFELAYSKSRMARCIESRAGAIVKPNDPQAFFVGLTERSRWQKVHLETMTDAGFVKIDPSSQTLRLECDSERMEIHGTSIMQCETESLQHPIDKDTEHWMVRLLVQTPTGQREILMEDGIPNWGRNTNRSRFERAETIANQIRALSS